MKYVLTSDNYRTLSYIDKKKYPVNYERPINEKAKNNLIRFLVKSGMNLEEIETSLLEASQGKKNEFTSIILNSNQGDDVTKKDILIPFFMGIVSILAILNVIY